MYRNSPSLSTITIIVSIHVAILQFLFDQYTLYTGIPLHFPRYTIIVTIHVLYNSYRSKNTRCIQVFYFTSHETPLLSLFVWQYYSCSKSIHVLYPYCPLLPTTFHYFHYSCGTTTVTFRSFWSNSNCSTVPVVCTGILLLFSR